ncbi:MAG: mitochondrial import inner membrane translocase subunit tim21 [Bogoriella megaspora]|nr:MAG: mitochondrial import inner membrane translocase subunit tim21 [Bogoriella megaspora]
MTLPRSSIRPICRGRPIFATRSLLYRKPYATQSSLTGSPSSSSRRKTITPFNDDGRVNWGDLSTSEKIARTAQQTFNFGLVIIGVLATGAVATYLYLDVFSTDSETAHFNRAANKINNDDRCIKILGKRPEFRNSLEASHSRMFRRNRRIPLRVEKDRFGTEWMFMRFYAVGEKAIGEVRLQMTKKPGESEWITHKLWMDVKGHQRIVLEDVEADRRAERKVPGKMFGVRWW